MWAIVLIPAGTSAELVGILAPSVGGTSIHVADLVVVGWFVAALSLALLRTGVTLKLDGLTLGVLLLLGWAGVSAAAGLVRSFGAVAVLRDFRGLLFYFALIPALLEVRSADQARNILKHFMAAAMAYGVLMCVLAVAPPGLPLVRETLVYWYGERRLHFHNTFLVPVAVTVAACVATYGTGRPRLTSLITLLVLFAALVISQTRSTLLVALVSVGLALLACAKAREVRFRPSEAGILAAGAALSGVGLLVLMSARSGLEGRLAELLTNPLAVGTFVDRFATFVSAADLWRERPLMGWGLGQSVPIPWATVGYKPWLGGAGLASGNLPGVDNSVLTAGFKTGLIGVALLVLVWVFTWRNACRAVKRMMLDSGLTNQTLAVIGIKWGLIGYVTTALTQSVLFSYRTTVIWMLLAAALSRLAIAPASTDGPRRGAVAPTGPR